MRVLCFIKVVVLGIAIVLLVLNTIGALLDWRMKFTVLAPSIHPFGNSITERQFYEAIVPNTGEPQGRETFVERVHHAVNRRIVFPVPGFVSEGMEALRIPIWRNYILYAAGLLWPEQYKYYEHCSWRRAVRRQVGLCSQHALVFTQILAENGIPAFAQALSGHVIATAETSPGVWKTYDPMYDVIIPHSMEEIEREPSLVVSFYARAGFSHDEVARLVDIYGPEGNGPYGLPPDCEWRNTTYTLIWIIPVILLGIALFLHCAGVVQVRREGARHRTFRWGGGF